MEQKLKRIGIISGKGTLPCLLAEEAKRQGYYVVMVALDPIADHLNGCADEIKRVNVGKLGRLIKVLKDAGITEAIMAGKVSKSLLYKSNIQPDMRAVKLLFKLKDKKDDTILQTITEELKTEGIQIVETTCFAQELLMPEGVITKTKPTTSIKKDIEFGYKIALEIGRLDIGQTVVVKDRAVMAVEAIEGTDEAIRRGGSLAGSGAVVVKVAKPQQDFRYDVPVVGIETLKTMIQVRASTLAVEAARAIIVQKDEMVKLADRHNISIIGITKESLCC